MVESQMRRRKPSSLQFVGDVARAEHAGGEADKGIQNDEDDVQVVDQNVRASRGFPNEQRQSGEKREESRSDVQASRQAIPRQNRQHGGSHHRNDQQESNAADGDGVHHCPPRYWSPRSRSRASRSTVSNRSRIRNRKIPITIKAIRTEKATLISTTSGMPLAPVAARMRPFSSDMKPITWPTALRRDTIISRPRRMTDR